MRAATLLARDQRPGRHLDAAHLRRRQCASARNSVARWCFDKSQMLLVAAYVGACTDRLADPQGRGSSRSMIPCRCDRQWSEGPPGAAVSSNTCARPITHSCVRRQHRAIICVRMSSTDGGHQVQVYLFRDQSGSNNFAYSTDVTGRNIPRPGARPEWRFVAVTPYQDISLDREEVIRHLERFGFYIFEG